MRTKPVDWHKHAAIASAEPRLIDQLNQQSTIVAAQDDVVFFEQHDIFRLDTKDGHWWRQTFGGELLCGRRIKLHPSEIDSDTQRALVVAPHPLPFACLPREHWRELFLETASTAMREVAAHVGKVDYVGASFAGHALPSEDDYGMLCFVDATGGWWGVDPVSVFFLGASGGDALNRLLLENPWRTHVGIVAERWSCSESAEAVSNRASIDDKRG